MDELVHPTFTAEAGEFVRRTDRHVRTRRFISARTVETSGMSGERRAALLVRDGQVVQTVCIWRHDEVAREHRHKIAGGDCAERWIAMRRQRMRITIETAVGQRAEAVGPRSGGSGGAMMLTSASAASRSAWLCLHHGHTKSREEDQQQQAGNWAPHEQGIH